MISKLRYLFLIVAIAQLAVPFSAHAQSVWVSDTFEVMLRTGPSTNNAIQLMMSSGSELQVLEEDPDSGYTKVRTGGGTEGWVLTRYLMNEASAREQLETLTRQLTSASAEGESMSGQLSAIRNQYNTATQTINTLEREKSELQTELDETLEKSANTLAIDSLNKNLQKQLEDAEINVSILERENEKLSAQSTRNWFIAGALVLIAGIILGLILPRLKFQRRSGYDRF